MGITYTAASAVNVLKEVQGDQDGTDDWYHGDEGGTVTANKTDSAYDDGYAYFRLTVTNMNEGQALANIVLMDIVPKEDGASFNSNITKDWRLDFDSIESVYIGSTEITADQYTLWYYTGTLETSSDVAAMQDAYDAGVTGDWVKAIDYTGSDITAFAVVFNSSVTLSYNEKLQLVYKATVPQMTETEAAAKAHLATYNDFRLLYQMQAGGAIGSDVYTLDSNYVYVLLETETVGVGGMAWIDADGNGKQESEDVTPNTYDADTDNGDGEDTATEYNSRTNNYASYNVVSALLDSITVQLNIYSGSTVSTLKTFSLLDAGNSWRFLFDGLTTANISSAYNDSTAYDDDGILWKALAGSTNATWYQLVTTVAGSDSIKYSLTGATTDMMSYDPADMYDDTVTGVLNDSNFRTSAGESGTDTITTGSTTAYSEKFFLYSGDEWNLAEDIGLVIYRDLTITKNDTNGSSPEAGSTFEPDTATTAA